tara:strand:- start:251 stop:727 length:477 start_codon:yes stop_codon:yes gene_type:complete
MSSRGKRTGARNSRKKVRNAKSKEVDGIKFRSLLEAHCYRQLRDAGIPANYEKKKYVLMEGFHYGNESYEDNGKTGYQDKQKYKVRDITYTPDFVDPQGRWIIECKGFANERFPLKWKMFKKLLMESPDPPVLFVPRNQKQNIETIQKILELMAPTVL